MKIRLGLLSGDSNYIDRLTAYLSVHCPEQIETFEFSSEEKLSEFVKTRRLDVVLAEPSCLSEGFKLPAGKLAYFSETSDVEAIRGESVVCKYQRADAVRSAILGLYAEAGSRETFRRGKSPTKLVAFAGASGGAGATLMAAACAKAAAASGFKALYLNLEGNGVVKGIFSDSVNAGMSEVLYAVKSKGVSLQVKLDSAADRDPSGVCFFEPYKTLLDAHEMTEEDAAALIAALMDEQDYDFIIADTDGIFTPIGKCAAEAADLIVIVCADTAIGRMKFGRIAEAFSIKDDEEAKRTAERCRVIMNRYGGRGGAEGTQIKCAGFVPEIEGDDAEIAAQAAGSGIFQRMLAEIEPA